MIQSHMYSYAGCGIVAVWSKPVLDYAWDQLLPIETNQGKLALSSPLMRCMTYVSSVKV